MSKFFGQEAEDAAAIFLKNQGYTILNRNYRTRWAEIDIIALDHSSHTIISPNGTLVFIEVKARNSTRYGFPSEAVSPLKQKKIISASLHYIREYNIVNTKIRFDVVTVISENGRYKIDIIHNAFECEGV